jgi:hypothetical protein
MNMSERPRNTADAETASYRCVFVDVTRIVIVNEVVPKRLAKNKPDKHNERKADTDS